MEPVRPRPFSWERFDPSALEPDVALQARMLEQHHKRYALAATHVRGRRVLDAACGTGYGSEMLRVAGASRVIGLDASGETIAAARTQYDHPDLELRVADLDREDLAPYGCDVCVSFETIEHLDSPPRFVESVRRSLPADGVFVASVPTSPTVDLDEYHKHDFTERSFTALVEAGGFRIVDRLAQPYRATLRDLREHARAPNALVSPRRDRLGFYRRHPGMLVRRAWLVLRHRGIELNNLTLVCVPR